MTPEDPMAGRRPSPRSRDYTDAVLDGRAAPQDPAGELLDAARAVATPADARGLDAALAAYRARPHDETELEPEARRGSRIARRLAAASLATKVALVAGAAAAAAGGVAVGTVTVHHFHRAPHVTAPVQQTPSLTSGSTSDGASSSEAPSGSAQPSAPTSSTASAPPGSGSAGPSGSLVPSGTATSGSPSTSPSRSRTPSASPPRTTSSRG